MPARKSEPSKPARKTVKRKAAPQSPPEGQDKPARRKAVAPPAKKAPAKKKAAPARKPRGAAASKASAKPAPKPKAPPAAPQRPSVAAQLLARKGAVEAPQPSRPFTNLEEAFFTEYMRNGQNGTAAWIFVHPGTKPDVAATLAWRLLRKVEVQDRIAAEKARLMKRHELSREQLLGEFLAIARADPNELVQMRAVACQRCWGGEQRTGQWTEPDPECNDCGGEGNAVPWIGDTRKLSPEARALYAGIQQTKEGIKVLMHDKVAALTAAGRIIGAFERDNEQKGKGTAEALRDFFGALHSANHAGLPIVSPGNLPSQRNPLVKG